MIDRDAKEIQVVGGRGRDEIGNLRVTFVLPDAGSFGRDKKVTVGEATAANAIYTLNGASVDRPHISVTEATQLVEQAQADEAKQIERDSAENAAYERRVAQVRESVANLSCLVCGGKSFEDRQVREDTRMQMWHYIMDLKVCRECGFVMQFLEQ
jgi:translation initiation factor 2 beta subunit (eIF-2beta)/eIF-5